MEKDISNKEKENEETVGDVFDTLTDKQKSVVHFMIGQAVNNQKKKDDNKEDDLK